MGYGLRKGIAEAAIMFAPSAALNAWAQMRGWDSGFFGRGLSVGGAVYSVATFAVSTLAYAAVIGVALMILPVLISLVAHLIVGAARLLVGVLDLPMRLLEWLEKPNAVRFRPKFELWASPSREAPTTEEPERPCA
jgi:hypothetical protein